MPGRLDRHQRRRRHPPGPRPGPGPHHRHHPVRPRLALPVQALQPRLPAREGPADSRRGSRDDADPLVSTDWLAEQLGDAGRPGGRRHLVPARPGATPDARVPQGAHPRRGVLRHRRRSPTRPRPCPTCCPRRRSSPAAVGGAGRRRRSHVVVYDATACLGAARLVELPGLWATTGCRCSTAACRSGSPRAGRSRAASRRRAPAVFTCRFRPELVRDLDAGARAPRRRRARWSTPAPPPASAARRPSRAPGLRAGHMPGARQPALRHPVRRRRDAEGPSRELAEPAAQAPASISTGPIITTCGSGVTACMIALALARLGRWDAAVYDGSWAEWGAPRRRPGRHGPA